MRRGVRHAGLGMPLLLLLLWILRKLLRLVHGLLEVRGALGVHALSNRVRAVDRVATTGTVPGVALEAHNKQHPGE